MRTVKNSEYTGIWHLHALASVLGIKIGSVYPEYGGFTVRRFLHRICVPRQSRSGL